MTSFIKEPGLEAVLSHGLNKAGAELKLTSCLLTASHVQNLSTFSPTGSRSTPSQALPAAVGIRACMIGLCHSLGIVKSYLWWVRGPQAPALSGVCAFKCHRQKFWISWGPSSAFLIGILMQVVQGPLSAKQGCKWTSALTPSGPYQFERRCCSWHESWERQHFLMTRVYHSLASFEGPMEGFVDYLWGAAESRMLSILPSPVLLLNREQLMENSILCVLFFFFWWGTNPSAAHSQHIRV